MTMIAWAVLALATPQDQPAPSPDEIVVTAPSEPFAVPIAKLRRAVDAFDKDRARFAPHGDLWFELRPKGGANADGLAVTLTDGRQSIPISLQPRGRFHLPPLPAGDGWTLRANRRGGALAFRALVRTPGFDDTQRRMGDLRLHCRVNFAVQGDRYSFFQRAAFATIGGCDTKHIAFYFVESRPITAASLRGRTLPIRDNSFFAPIGVKGVSNDETIALAFR